jgi:serine/threonine-protein kinase
MAVSISEILARLESSGILTLGDLASVRAEATAAGLDGDGEAFLKRSHKAGRITGYQAQALWKDKGNKLAFGNYVIEDELGRGGMGVVLKARHKRMQRHVAIKVLPTTMVKNAGAIARFQREVVAAAQLTHTNIVGAPDRADHRLRPRAPWRLLVRQCGTVRGGVSHSLQSEISHGQRRLTPGRDDRHREAGISPRT